MSLLNTVQPQNATGEVAEIYAQMQQAMGRVPTGLQLYSENPALLREYWTYIGSIMQHPTLSPALTTTIRMLVSVQSQCAYCIDMNAGMLIGMMNWTPEQVAATRADFRSSPLADEEKILLGLVLKSVRDSNSVTPLDLEDVRAAGWSDRDILDAVYHGARMVAGDIMMNAFKVERDF